MHRSAEDPHDVDVLVVHATDVVTALAATAQGRETVLRVTPPFHRRQRARLHRPAAPASTADQSDAVEPVQIPATAFVDDNAPGFPRAAETAPEPPDAPDYDVQAHHERQTEAVEEWRDALRAHLEEEVRVADSDHGTLEFDVRYLG